MAYPQRIKAGTCFIEILEQPERQRKLDELARAQRVAYRLLICAAFGVPRCGNLSTEKSVDKKGQ